ncbi:MAG: N-6 DNA methylase, partial [Verrucomicrobiales bacterium]|nr:N-6 DNA methylase [Verrucomicrobiales bacterium]
MKEALADILNRFLAPLSQHPSLRVASTQTVEDSATLHAPLGTALLHGLREGQAEPLALLAITSPHLAPDAPALLAFAVRRAQAHKAPYFLTWTLRDAVLWRTPKPGTPAERAHLEVLRDYVDNFEVPPSATARIAEPLRRRLLEASAAFITDLERLCRDEALELVRIDATWFVERLIQSVHDLLPLVTDSLHQRLDADLALRQQVAAWAVKQGIPGSHADRDFAESIARQIIYRLLGKILFYQSLRRAARKLPPLDLDGVDTAQILPTLRRAFAEALKIDYHAVFAEDLPDTIQWPAEAARRLAALVHDFNTRDFSRLPQDVVGTVFERLIPPEERHRLGQYFTRELLCDIILAFCIRSANDKLLDPTCGTGTFNIRGYDRLKWLGRRDHTRLLEQIWGIDIAPFPAELAVINLFRQDLSAAANFPRVACRDFFTLSPGDTLPFPPPKMDLDRPETIQEPIPLFDAIVGNFPYVSQDQIEKADPNYKEFLRQRLVDGWFDIYPQLFCYDHKKDQAKFEQAIAQGLHRQCDRAQARLRISTYADLYVYLFFHAARFLAPGGRMGIVTSNAWLDVNYGFELQRFFCDRFKIVAILESRCEPWFTEAAVNTVVTILERCDSPAERDRHIVKFVKVKKPLAEMCPTDPGLLPAEHWRRLERLVQRIEDAGRPYAKTSPLGCVTVEDADLRLRLCRQGELRAELEREGKTVKWGKYLRAPEAFFDMLKTGKFCLLKEIAEAARGSLSGNNEFYHLTPEQAAERGIEPEFLQPVLKSPGESNRIPIEQKLLGLRLFVCRLTKEELAKKRKLGALQYIEWGERQVFTSGVQAGQTWPHGAEVRVRKPGWYAIPEHRSTPAHVFIAKAFDERHMFRFSKRPVIADNRLYFLSPLRGVTHELLAAVLNSSLSAFCVEVCGRVAMGDGALELMVEDVRDYLLVPDVRGASAAQKRAIIDAFEKLCQRDIGSVFDEVKQKDRQALDIAVLKAIGLDPRRFLQPIYDGLCELVRERIELGRQRGKARKTRARRATAEKE